MTKRECAVIMAHTGVCMLSGDDMKHFYEYLQDLFGRPVYTHEWLTMEKEIKSRSRPDFLKLCNGGSLESTPDHSGKR